MSTYCLTFEEDTTVEFTLPREDADGEEIVYTIDGIALPAGGPEIHREIKDDPFFSVSQVNPQSLAQIDNATSLFQRLLEEGLNGFVLGDIAGGGEINDPLVLRQALDDLDTINGNVTFDGATNRSGNSDPDWYFEVRIEKTLSIIVDLDIAGQAVGGLGEIELEGEIEIELDVILDFAFGLASCQKVIFQFGVTRFYTH